MILLEIMRRYFQTIYQVSPKKLNTFNEAYKMTLALILEIRLGLHRKSLKLYHDMKNYHFGEGTLC